MADANDDGIISPDASETIDFPVSRRAMLAVGVPAVVAMVAAGAAPFLIGSRSGPSIASSGVDLATTTSSTPPAPERPILPGSTTSTTTTSTTTTAAPTTAAPTTTSAPTTTTTAVAQPIAPPADVRGDEEFVQLGSISIPKLGVDEPLLEGIRLTTLDLGPGHWPGSAMPGEVGNVVVAAHRTSHGGPFRHIDQLVAGDVVSFTTDGVETEYRVIGTQIVEPEALWIVDPTPEPTATLFACHPPGSVAQRIVVNLELVA